MKGFYSSEQGHWVCLLAPGDASGATTDIIGMKQAAHASIVVSVGSVTSAVTCTLKRCDDFSGSNATAMAFGYHSVTTALSDVMTTRTSGGSNGITLSTTSGAYYVLEVDAASLITSSPNLYVEFSSASATVSVMALLSGVRDQKSQNSSVLS